TGGVTYRLARAASVAICYYQRGHPGPNRVRCGACVAKRAKATKESAPAKKAQLRRIMLDAAAKLFAERGFAGTNLQDIADALGISRPSLYYYFSNKEKILASLVEEVTVFSQQQSTRIAAATDANPGETLRLMTASHAKSLLDHAV